MYAKRVEDYENDNEELCDEITEKSEKVGSYPVDVVKMIHLQNEILIEILSEIRKLSSVVR